MSVSEGGASAHPFISIIHHMYTGSKMTHHINKENYDYSRDGSLIDPDLKGVMGYQPVLYL